MVVFFDGKLIPAVLWIPTHVTDDNDNNYDLYGSYYTGGAKVGF